MVIPDFMLWGIIHGGSWSPRNPKGPGAPDGDGRLVQKTHLFLMAPDHGVWASGAPAAARTHYT